MSSSIFARATKVLPEILRASQELGVPEEIALAKAIAESSLNPQAQAKGSTASGLFQITKGTWETLIKEIKKVLNIDVPAFNEIVNGVEARFHPRFNSLVGIYYIKKLMESIPSSLGISKDNEYFEEWVDIAYHLGEGGASQFKKYLASKGWSLNNYDKDAIFELKSKGKVIASLSLGSIIERAKKVAKGSIKQLAKAVIGVKEAPTVVKAGIPVALIAFGILLYFLFKGTKGA